MNVLKKSQQRLKEEFDFKKEILTLDSKDHQCLNKFYNLQPNNELIQLALEIWQATANELKNERIVRNSSTTYLFKAITSENR